jgi:hypothetical protein
MTIEESRGRIEISYWQSSHRRHHHDKVLPQQWKVGPPSSAHLSFQAPDEMQIYDIA